MVKKQTVEKHITVNPDIQHGKPCIRNTRIPVYAVLEALATGMDFEEVKKEFKPLTTDDIQACIFYAALLTNEEELIGHSAK